MSGRAGPPRVAAILVIAALLAALVVAQRSASSPAPVSVRRPGVLDGPTVPAAETAGAVTWFCAEGTANEGGRADETILIANLSPDPIEAIVTVMPGSGEPFAVDRVAVDALAQARVPVADLVETGEPGVVVEVLGGPAVVEHELRADDDVAVGPCARAAARDWLFAGGTTARGAEDWLSLFNPFGQDAIVDVTFLTAAGLQRPGATEALAVPRNSRISVPLHEQLLREDRLAIAVRARSGRVVAEHTLRFDGSETPPGLASSLGVEEGATRWRVAAGDAQSGSAPALSIANFTDEPSRVEVDVLLSGDTSLEPETVDVAARSVARVDLAERVPVGSDYTIELRARGAPVVVEAFGAWSSPATVSGVATANASVTEARRWAFAGGRVDDAGDAVISALNVSDRPLTVQLYAYTAGDPDSPASAPARAVSPGERAGFPLSELGIRPDQVLVVQAEGPIVVWRLLLGSGVSMAPGIPDPEA